VGSSYISDVHIVVVGHVGLDFFLGGDVIVDVSAREVRERRYSATGRVEVERRAHTLMWKYPLAPQRRLQLVHKRTKVGLLQYLSKSKKKKRTEERERIPKWGFSFSKKSQAAFSANFLEAM
jgi:hypothetical protein